jgi:hypothetical protein
MEVLESVAVDVGDAGGKALLVVLDANHVRLGAQVELAGGRRLGELGDERRPPGTHLVALERGAVLDRGRATVTRHRVDGHPAVWKRL